MNHAVRMRVNENGRVVLPSAVRKALEIRPGDEVLGWLEGDELRIATRKSRIQRAQRRVRRYVPRACRLADELIAQRREAARGE